jgi:hypothetical protein
MYYAAGSGQVAAMQMVVQHGADVHNTKGTPWSSPFVKEYSRLPVFAAADWGQLEAIRWLHEQGMTEDEVGVALEAAADKAAITRYLLQDCGANVSIHGPVALGRAMKYRHLEVVCLLLQAGTPADGATILQAAQLCLMYLEPQQLDTLLQAGTQHGQTEFADMLQELRAAATRATPACPRQHGAPLLR